MTSRPESSGHLAVFIVLIDAAISCKIMSYHKEILMGNIGSVLASGQFMNVDDYLTSPNGMFFAYMQGDGNFCVYRGTPAKNLGALWCWSNEPHSGQFFAAMQADGNFCVYRGTPSNNEGGLWCWTGSAHKDDQYFLTLQDDANLCVYRGEPGLAEGGALWCTMKLDSATFTAEKIEYHIPDISKPGTPQPVSTDLTIYRQKLPNNGSTKITTRIHQEEKVQESRGWSNALRVAVTAGVETSVGVPLFGEGKISLSTTVENTYTWNGSRTEEKSWGFEVETEVPPHATVSVDIIVTMTQISVPYTLTGIFTYASGERYRGTMEGVYTGVNSHDLVVQSRDGANTDALPVAARVLSAAQT